MKIFVLVCVSHLQDAIVVTYTHPRPPAAHRHHHHAKDLVMISNMLGDGSAFRIRSISPFICDCLLAS